MGNEFANVVLSHPAGVRKGLPSPPRGQLRSGWPGAGQQGQTELFRNPPAVASGDGAVASLHADESVDASSDFLTKITPASLLLRMGSHLAAPRTNTN